MRSEEDETDFADTLAAPEKPESGLDDADRRQLLESALHKLPDAQRVPLVLFHFEEMAYEDIAQKLGVSLSKVKTDIHRGRHALKRYLQPRLAADDRFDEPSRRPTT
jgi:RNA polymerase sigma-70 factor (ECF subfamily)